VLLAELKRRNVFRVAMFYVVAGWVLLQAGDLLFDTLGVPGWGLKLLLGLLVLGFPLALVFAWVYELTPEGLKREHEVDRHASTTARTAAKLDKLIVVLLVVAIGLLVAEAIGSRRGAIDRDAGSSDDSRAAVQPAGVNPRASSGGKTDATQVSIAVLPFLNLSEDKSNEYFSDGLTEELLNVLANVPGLRVIARTSSFAYKGKDAKISDVARELDVDHVLEGSVRKSGNRVRITTQLIRASDSSHLWSENYDRNLDDIFAVQDEISKHVVDALKVRLLPGQDQPVEVGGTRDPEAYEAFLLGRHRRALGEGETTLREALAAFDEAIRRDPDYAQAYAARAGTLSALASNAYIPFATGFEQVRQAAQRSLELAPNLAEGHIALGYVQSILENDVRTPFASFERALELNPGSETVQRLYAGYASSLGRHDAAIAAAQKAVALDPISPAAHLTLSAAQFGARQYAKADSAARRALALQPNRPAGPAALGWSLLMQGRHEEALAAFEADPTRWVQRNGRTLVLARMGRKDEARRELETFQQESGDNAAYQYAEAEAQLGDLDAALRWLEKAREIHDPGLTGFGFIDPMLDPLRKDPRFQRMFADLGFDVAAT
jgi:TolB-like protein/tetratricopeptide (TPR) repeat protein